MDVSIDGIVSNVTDMSPAALCFLVVYGLGIMLKKQPQFNNDWLGYALVVISGLFYMFTGELSSSRNPLARAFVDGIGIGVIAWLMHYYHEQLPFLKKFFPDSKEAVQAKQTKLAKLANPAVEEPKT